MTNNQQPGKNQPGDMNPMVKTEPMPPMSTQQSDALQRQRNNQIFTSANAVMPPQQQPGQQPTTKQEPLDSTDISSMTGGNSSQIVGGKDIKKEPLSVPSTDPLSEPSPVPPKKPRHDDVKTEVKGNYHSIYIV